MGDKMRINTFKTSSIKIGNFEKNPHFVDFGDTSLSCLIQFPGTNGKEDEDLLDIEYQNIRALRCDSFISFKIQSGTQKSTINHSIVQQS
jgi:hypothetical protein